MEDQIPVSQPPVPQPTEQPEPGAEFRQPFTPFDLEAMKAQARELALQQVLAARVNSSPQVAESTQAAPQETVPQVVYVRRNLTVAELLLVFALSCGLVYGIPNLFGFIANNVPRVEIKFKR